MLLTLVAVSSIATWVLILRPYRRKHGQGFTPGADCGVTFWVDWQQATELARKNENLWIIGVCRTLLLIHIVFALIFVFGLYAGVVAASGAS